MESSKNSQTPDWVIRRIQKGRPANYIIIALNLRTGELWNQYDCTIKKYTDRYYDYCQHEAEKKGWNVKYYPVIVCPYAEYHVKINQRFLQYLLLTQHPLENFQLNSGYLPAWFPSVL